MKRLLILTLLSTLMISCGSSDKSSSAVIGETIDERDIFEVEDERQLFRGSAIDELTQIEEELNQLGIRPVVYPYIDRVKGYRFAKGHRASNTKHQWWSRSCSKSISRAEIQNDGELESFKRFLFVFKSKKGVKEKCLPTRFLVPTNAKGPLGRSVSYCERLRGMEVLGIEQNKKFHSTENLAEIREVSRRYIDIASEYISQEPDAENCIDQAVVAEKMKLIEQAFGVREIVETEEI